jgi:putative methyltransferase (TIGR04325 family)
MLRDILPPLVWNQLRRVKVIINGGHSVYEPHICFSPDDLPLIQEDVWVSKNQIESQSIFSATKEFGLGAGLNDDGVLNINASALLLASLISLQKGEPPKKAVRILDIGAGLSGGFYLAMQKRLSSMAVSLQYAVVDGRLNCDLGSRFFASRSNIEFFDFESAGLEAAAKHLGEIDACNISSTLQYLIDWKEALASIVRVRPGTIVISRTPFSDHAETEAYGIQNVSTSKGYCGKAKVVMIPGKMLVQEMANHGYECLVEHGAAGDASWYWQAGCKRKDYFSLTNRCFVFVKQVP